MNRIKRRIIASILSFSIAISMIPFNVFAKDTEEDTITKENIQTTTFIKTGSVVTLYNKGSDYFLKTEYFNADGTYSQPATEIQLSYAEYSQRKANKNYDVIANDYQQVVNNIYVDMSTYFDSNGSRLLGSYIGRIIDGDFGEIIVNNNNSNQQTILLNDNEEIFYVITKFFDSNGDYSRAASYTMLSASQYNELKNTKNYDYEIENTYEMGTRPYKITSFYDINGNPIIRPIIIEIYAVADIEDFFELVEEKPEPEIPEPEPPDPEPETPEPEPEPETPEPEPKPEPEPGGQGENGDNGNGIDQPLPPWTGSTWEWSESAIDGDGFTPVEQAWADSWMDVTVDSSWFDSFNSEMGENGTTDGEAVDVSDFGFIDDNGQFIETDANGNILPTEDGTFDDSGNFTPEGEDGYYDQEGVFHPGEEGEGEDTESEGENEPIIDENGNVISPTEDGADGIKEDDGSFNQGDEGVIDSEGNVIGDGVIQDGSSFLAKAGSLMINEYGQLYIKGNNEIYDETGLATLPTGKTGYYNENGTFTENIKNLNESLGGFYDSTGKWHSFNEFYIDSNGDIQLVLYPAFGMTSENNRLKLNGYDYDEYGLTSQEGKIGFFDTDGMFTVSDTNPYKNGFFDSEGDWISDALYIFENRTLSVSSAWFDPYGTYTTPSKDRGYFNSEGKFIIGEKNQYSESGYYNYDGELVPWGALYKDSLGYIHETGKNGYYNEEGKWIDAEVVDGVLDSKNNYHNMFNSKFSETGEIGHYTISGEMIKGFTPYVGFVDDIGNILTSEGNFLVEGKIKHYNQNGEIGLSYNLKADGYYNSTGDFMRYNNTIITKDYKLILEDGTVIEGTVDENGNIILPDGTVITPDGTIGYYDENGNFVEGDIMLPEGAYYDENGNIVLPDGTVILPDGTVGYYDENGNFVEGEIPYEDGYYDAEGNWHPAGEDYYIDKDGNMVLADGTIIMPDGTKILPDGTVITPDGTVGYFDENGNFVEALPEGAVQNADGSITLEDGTVILPDGTTILPDGTVILPDGTIGYYDENGNFVEGEIPYEDGYYDENGNWVSTEEALPEGAYYDENGNLVLPDGTIITPDGVTILPDGTQILPDGTQILPDGTQILPDGTKILPDGTVVLPDGTVGYYDENGNFVEALPEGAVQNADGSITLEDGTVIMPDGTVITPDGTVISPDGAVGEMTEGGFVETLPEGAVMNPDGSITLADGTIIMPDGTKILPDGTVVLPDGTVGYYDENGNFVEALPEGAIQNADGSITLEDGTVIMPDGTVITPDGTAINADGDIGTITNGEFVEGLPDGAVQNADGSITLADGTIIMPDGTKILPDGTVVLPDGTIGYYDENGNFVEALPEGAVQNADGSITLEDGTVIMPDGTVITPDGTAINADGDVGTIENQGEFVEGLPEGAVQNADGSITLADGTQILPDGTKVLPDGTVVLPDGTVGYYDENGEFVEALPEGAIQNADGSITLEDGTVIMPDGTVITPDGTAINADGDIGQYETGKALFTSRRFEDVSVEAKVLYGFLLDRMGLSAKNGWKDEEGRVYIIFTVEAIMEHLKCSNKKAVSLLRELEEKAGLIERRRQGLGRPSLIYVKNFIEASEERFKR